VGRLKPELLDRVETFGSCMLDVVDELAAQGRSRRIQEQLAGCGTSVGANTYEADEAMTRPDFCRTLAIIVKEINECRFWLRLLARRGWIEPETLRSLETEAKELKLIYGSMLSRTRKPRRTTL
jgi:four helix bundle protein